MTTQKHCIKYVSKESLHIYWYTVQNKLMPEKTQINSNNSIVFKILNICYT